jgi:hypothetical protein
MANNLYQDYLDNFVIIRTYSAGVFAGTLKQVEKDQVELENAIRIWYWEGAFSLSQLAMEGVKKPDECKFAVIVDKILLNGVIEIIKTTKEAENNIKGVAPWKK